MQPENSVKELQKVLRDFAIRRDWEQFHSPKNLSMALIVEAAELVEHFQWLTQDESKNLSPDKLSKVKDEVADILIFLIRFCDVMGIDPIDAAFNKVKKNELKYPDHLAKGTAKKYNELKEGD